MPATKTAHGPVSSPDFLKFWLGQSVSMAGSQVSLLAIPLLAAVVLDASPLEMGLLRALEFVPVLVLGFPAGAWLDRVRRRPVMIGAELGQAILLASFPVLAVFHVLRLEHVYALAFLTGCLSLLFEIAQSAWLPSLFQSKQLTEANSKLELSRWSIQVSGPGAASALVQAVGAPIALLADAASFVISALLLSRIRLPEQPWRAPTLDGKPWDEVVAGLRLVRAEPALRWMAITAAVSNLFAYTQAAVLLLYVTRELSLPATAYGIILAAFGLGGVCGSPLAPRLIGRMGYSGAMVTGALLMASGDGLVAAAAVGQPLVGLVVGQFLTGFGLPLCTISMVSLRQAITPSDLLGRVNATNRVLAWGALPIGAILGGALGESIGLRPTLVIAAAGSALVLVWVCRVVAPATRRVAVALA